jgi:hypothetical protein
MPTGSGIAQVYGWTTTLVQPEHGLLLTRVTESRTSARLPAMPVFTFRGTRSWWMPGVVFAGATGIFAARLLTLRPSFTEDAWVYMLSGQAVAAGRPPPVALTNTTPKPLATLLAVLVSPLPPVRAMDILAALAAGLLASATCVYGYRVAGALGAAVAVAALVAIPAFPIAFYAGQTDLTSAALLVAAIVAGARSRVVFAVLLGLLRPQAWILAGAAAYLASSGSRLRRVLVGAAFTLLPALLWVVWDVAVNRDALATWDANQRINQHVPWHSPVVTLRFFVDALTADTRTWLLLLGIAGFAVAARSGRWREDPFVPCVLGILPFTLIATWSHMPYNTRYTFPIAALVPLGCAHLASLVPRSERTRAAGAVVVVVSFAILGVFAIRLPQDAERRNVAAETAAALRTAPLVDRALHCGAVRVHGRLAVPWFYSIRLAGATKHPLTDFRYRAGDARTVELAGVGGLIVGPFPSNRLVTSLTQKGWQRHRVGNQTLWLAPDCGT